MALDHKDTSRIFGVLQGVVLAVVVATAVYYRRRQKNLENDIGAKLSGPDLRAFIRRTPVARPGSGPAPTADDSETSEEAPPPAKPPKLESAFPAWTKDTPPHEILGVKPGASQAEIESAYKARLKKFHPDRFASWGGGYQNRAHHVVLLIQGARDRLLSEK